MSAEQGSFNEQQEMKSQKGKPGWMKKIIRGGAVMLTILGAVEGAVAKDPDEFPQPAVATEAVAATDDGTDSENPPTVETPPAYTLDVPYPTFEGTSAEGVNFIADNNSIAFKAIEKLKEEGLFTPVSEEQLLNTGIDTENRKIRATITGCTTSPQELVPGYSADFCGFEFKDELNRRWVFSLRLLPQGDGEFIKDGDAQNNWGWDDAVRELKSRGRGALVELNFDDNFTDVATQKFNQVLWADTVQNVTSPTPFRPQSYGEDPRLQGLALNQLDSYATGMPQPVGIEFIRQES